MLCMQLYFKIQQLDYFVSYDVLVLAVTSFQNTVATGTVQLVRK